MSWRSELSRVHCGGLTPYEALRAGSLSSGYAPGTIVRELALAVDLGVSRTPVREALLRLEQEGLLERTARGMRVKRRTLEELAGVYEAILVIEPAVSGLAALRARSQDLVRLESLIADAGAAIADGADPHPLMDAWHFALWQAADSPALEDALKRLSTLLYAIPAPAVGLTDWSASLDHHREILAALRSHDVETATALMRSHMEKGRDAALRTLAATHNGTAEGGVTAATTTSAEESI